MKVPTNFKEFLMEWIIGLMQKEKMLYGIIHQVQTIGGILDPCQLLDLSLLLCILLVIHWKRSVPTMKDMFGIGISGMAPLGWPQITFT